MYGSKKRLVILLSILGALVLGFIIVSVVYGTHLVREQQYAQERAEAAQYIRNTDNWVDIENQSATGSIGYIDNIFANASATGAMSAMQDSDGDSYPDVYEQLVGTDPSKAETFSSSNPARYTLECDEAQLSLSGTPVIASAQLDVNLYNKSRNAAFASKIYELTYPEKEEDLFSAELSIAFKTPEGQNPADAVINQILPNGTLTPQETTVDTANCVATCKLEHFSSYVVVFEELLDYKLNSIPAVVLSIDDSGSMYYYNGDDDCNNDPDLLRYDFCTEIINSTGGEADFAMNYFAGTVTDGFSFGEKSKTMKKFIQELKKVPEEEKNFTGTCLGSALEKSVSDVLSVNNPSRFIICLTDGESTEGYDKWDKAVQKCRDENITLIVIGLGDQVNKDRLSADSVSTGGYYLNVKDANCIETITDSILAVINNKGIQVLNIYDKNGENTLVNTYLVADSGFDLNRHAGAYGDYHVFTTANGSTTEIGSQSAGVAELTREWYLDNLKPSMAPAKASLSNNYSKEVLAENGKDFKIALPDYDLSKIACNTETDLAEITIPSLRAIAEYNSIINDYVNAGVNMRVENSCLLVNDDMIPEYITSNPDRFYKVIVELAETKYYTDAKHKKLEFNQICVYYPNINYYIDNDVSNDDDYLIRVIYTMYTQQLSSRCSTNYFRTPEGIIEGSGDNDALLADISDKLLHGDPCVLVYDSTGSAEAGHADRAMNAVALYRACDDAKVYYLKCYDNEGSGKYIYFRIETANPESYVITDMWRNQQTQYFGTQTIN